MKMVVFWVAAPCGLIEVYRSFRGSALPPSLRRRERERENEESIPTMATIKVLYENYNNKYSN
jgi:hypothetical protein